MSYEMIGTIKRISDEKKITENFTYKEFILFIPGDWEQNVKFQVSNKKLGIVDKTMIGNEVTVHFNINGRVTKTGYWNTLNCWKIESKTESNDPYQAQPPDPDDVLEDDIPF